MMAVMTNGPLDGLVYPLKEGQKVVELFAPRMTAAQMIAMDIVMKPIETVPAVTFVYIEQPGKLSAQGFAIFIYSGERNVL